MHDMHGTIQIEFSKPPHVQKRADFKINKHLGGAEGKILVTLQRKMQLCTNLFIWFFLFLFIFTTVLISKSCSKRFQIFTVGPVDVCCCARRVYVVLGYSPATPNNPRLL